MFFKPYKNVKVLETPKAITNGLKNFRKHKILKL